MGVCNASDEMGHMDAVFSGENFANCDVGSFSNIVANATTGWVSNQLGLKGVNITFAPGHHAGIQALAYAFEMVSEARAEFMLAGAADEVYAQTYFNYNLMEFLYKGEDEVNYRFQPDVLRRKVIGEGAAFLALEEMAEAKARGARILGEVLSCGMAMDASGFNEQNLQTDGLIHAIETALVRAELKAAAIDAIVWAPQGNIQDCKVIAACTKVLGTRFEEIPLLTSTFNTGYLESASLLASAAIALEAVAEGNLWKQMTGNPDLDSRNIAVLPKNILLVGSSDVGYNFSAIIRAGEPN